MIIFTWAKKLKEVGFPQTHQKTDPWMDFFFDSGEELHLLHSDNDTGWYIGNDYTHSEMTDADLQKDWVKCPTFDELMQECIALGINQFVFQIQEDGSRTLVADGMGYGPYSSFDECLAHLYYQRKTIAAKGV